MTMHDLLIDTAVPLHAVGGEHPHRESCRSVLAAATEGRVILHASVEMVQEFLFHRLRISARTDAIADTEALMQSVKLHDFDNRVILGAIDLVGSTSVRGRDAVHAATALVHGLTGIVSPDHAFDGVPGLTRLDPADV